MSSKSSRDRLPFEPRQKKKKIAKQPATQSNKATEQSPTLASDTAKSGAIPEAVSKRMIRRMALFCGIPTVLGMSSFVAAYWIVRHEWFKIPTIAVVFVSLGLFGLGVLGLSYGLLSTSWDEDKVGSWHGWQEFKVNVGRITAARGAKKGRLDT